MTARGQSPKKRKCEREYPIRIRIRVPEEGFGKQLDEMFAWLDREVGRGNYEHHADSQPQSDATAFYFCDPQHALLFVSEFDLELCDLRD